MELVPFTSEPLTKTAVEKAADVVDDVDRNVCELGDGVDKKDVMTEKEKRRLEILLEEKTPELTVEPSIISRLNDIDRELNMLKGERLTEGSRRSVSPQEDVLAICDNGWNEVQNRLDQIDENMAVIQTTNQRQRLLPLRDSKNRLFSTITITEDVSDENED